jgi:Holliday junction resolvase RusA-like endonuclease
MLRLKIPLNPVPASRPKVPRYGKVYYGKRYTQWRKDATVLVSEASSTRDSLLSATVVFAVERSKTGLLTSPVGDGDNYEKAVYDLLQAKKYMMDDRQIVEGHWIKTFVPYGEPGYTEIVLKELDGLPNITDFLSGHWSYKT